MKYKALKSAVHNLGRSFASSLNWRDNDYVMSQLARAVVKPQRHATLAPALWMVAVRFPALLARIPAQAAEDVTP